MYTYILYQESMRVTMFLCCLLVIVDGKTPLFVMMNQLQQSFMLWPDGFH